MSADHMVERSGTEIDLHLMYTLLYRIVTLGLSPPWYTYGVAK